MSNEPRCDYWVTLVHLFGVTNGGIAIVTVAFSFMFLNGRYLGEKAEAEYLASIHWGWNQLGVSIIALGLARACRLIEARWPPR